MTGTGDPHSKEKRALAAAVVVAVAGIAAVGIAHPSLEQPILLVGSALALCLLTRIAAFPSRDGLLLRNRSSISLACGNVIAIALVQWCPWDPVHANRGFLMLAVLMLLTLAQTAFGIWSSERDHTRS